jgi:hypothetical protein
MKTKRFALLAMITVLILLVGVAAETSGLFAGAPQKAPKEHRVHIKKMKNKWRVVDAQDSTSTLVKAGKGDDIVWTALGSDVFLQFGDSTVFGTHNAVIKTGQKLTLTVLPTALPGRYPYAAFCVRDNEFASGDSPPVIIIQ